MGQDKIKYNTKKGAIVSISDQFEGYPLKDVKADIEPIQDLNGYDKPWSGGAGKNLYNYETTTQNSWLDTSDGSLINGISGYWTSDYIPISAETDYVKTTSGSSRACFYDSNKEFVSSVSWVGGTKTTPSNVAYCRFVGSTSTIAYDGQVQFEKGTTLSSWTPYSNICPISGRTECVTEVAQTNIWNEVWELGRLDFNKNSPTWGQNVDTGNQIRSKDYLSIKPNTSYYCKSGTASTIYAIFYDAEKQPVLTTTNSGYMAIANQAFTTPSGAYYLRFYALATSTYANDISINYPSTDTSYHAYEGNTYTTTLGRTVYGGTLDVASGVLTVDRAVITLNGTESDTWYLTNASTKQTVYATPSLLPNVKTSGGYQQTAVCNSLGIALAYSQATIGMAYVDSGYFNMVFAPSTFSTSADVKTWLASNNVQLVYELATPTTVQLTAQEVELLVGTNNIWANSGDVTVTYATKSSVIPVKIYAGSSASNLSLLPSPTKITSSRELIWSENTGRAQSGSKKAKMIGDVVAEKDTYAIEWGVIEASDYNTIKSKLSAGFFNFGIGLVPTSLGRFYRSEIQADLLVIGGKMYYKDVTVQVIEQ